MSYEYLRGIVLRRVRVRRALKPVKAWWHSRGPDPDWLIITHWTGRKAFECFELNLLKAVAPTCGHSSCQGQAMANIGEMSYETLRIAKAQAHADIGVEYVEWEPCQIQIGNEDGSIDWTRAVPIARSRCSIIRADQQL